MLLQLLLTFAIMTTAITGYGPITGTIAKYHPFIPLTTIISVRGSSSPTSKTTRFGVLLGGLSDAHLPMPYNVPLAKTLDEVGYALVNPVLRSAGLQFGWGSLEEDVEDIKHLIEFLEKEYNAEEVVLIGHSTGCQQCVKFLEGGDVGIVKGVILQGPVSDRETDENNEEWVELSEEMIGEGKGNEFLPRAAFWAPITAKRFCSLYGVRCGGDDYFSSDFTEEEMGKSLGGLKDCGAWCFAVYSKQDQYCPKSVDKEKLLRSWNAVGIETALIDGDHNLSTGSDEFLDIVRNKLASKKAEEDVLRYDLAVAHAMCHEYKMDELVWNHISARYGDGWLITPGRMHWDEIGPKDIVMSSDNVTADIIHSAVYSARKDVNAIVHLHTPNAVAVGCLERGFEALTQDGSFFYEKIATHEWEGVSDDPEEGPRIGEAVMKVPNCNILLMPNHGFCTFGSSVREAWVQAFYFEKACETLIMTLNTGQAIKWPKEVTMRKSAAQNYSDMFRPGTCEWDALVRLYERKYVK
ncbi:hypothetical protein TL16_g02733 [Triparma laevis f. inornata]|uniref:Class II aldolase/adducin N-terminal domain-containing protein n=1 Tax=Triparma laevis f. inornata TaxID=1714386 RepID=A0A9W6ZX63_9STRA|nr:hypothetical protein TL16_g02733 [Triparma laevis f. inornata]